MNTKAALPKSTPAKAPALAVSPDPAIRRDNLSDWRLSEAIPRPIGEPVRVFKNGYGALALLENEHAEPVAVMRDGAGNYIQQDTGKYWRPDGVTGNLNDPLPDPWSDPEPLPAGLPPVAPFNLALLPAAFRPWIGDIAERMQCPTDYPAVAAIVTLASVVGRQVAIRPKRKDDWTVTANLWGAVIGRPSLLKTPAIQEPIKMIEALESKAREAFERDERDHAAEALIAKVQAKETDKLIAKALRDRKEDLAHNLALEATRDLPPPVRSRYMTHDTTVEKLGELLRDNPRGVLIYRDELIGFLRALDQEGREGSRAFYLEAWNGSGAFRFDRIGRGTVEIEAACVSIIGGIQPGPLGDYILAAIRGGLGDDGLAQRFQLAVWPDAPGTWRNVDRWPDTEARRAAREVYERLDQINPAAIGATKEDGDSLPWVRFDAEAQGHFDAWREILETRLRSDQIHAALESHLAKFRSLVPSLALLFHLADNPAGGPVTGPALSRALSWADYLETHARRIYAPALTPSMASAIELDRRLSALPEPFTARDVSQRNWRLLDQEGTAGALSVLVEKGRIRREESTGPGRRTTRYTVNPALKDARK
jgi:putative DNA primase/helicase